MEGLTTRVWALAAVIVGLGAFVALTPKSTAEVKTEDQLEQLAPTQLGEFQMIRSREDSAVSYRMDDRTYEELKPFGIVARVFEAGNRSYDVVVIASNRHESFHDPRVCFSAQGWTFTGETQDVIKTSRGDVPVTHVTMVSGGTDGRKRTNAQGLFFYKGPGGFSATTLQLKWGMFKSRLSGNTNVDGVFYRIIPRESGTTKEELFEFTAKWLEKAGQTSNNYF